jgi:hypothetical protein
MTDSDDLIESLRHLEYETAMMVATQRMMRQHPLTPALNTSRPDGYYWANDQAVAYLAGMESALTHARLLDDFYRHTTASTNPLKADDRYAVEYCKEKGWTRFELLTHDQRTAINKQLSHFTTQRGPRKTHPLGRYAGNAIRALELLTRQADPQWQQPLKNILAKAQAEHQRSQEAWNPRP